MTKKNVINKVIVLNEGRCGYLRLTVGPLCYIWQCSGTELSTGSYLYGGAAVKAK